MELEYLAILPFQLLQSLGIEGGYERSFKIIPGWLLSNRYLLAVPTSSLHISEAQYLGEKLGMPSGLAEPFWRTFDRANLLLIGFEEGPLSVSYKLYLEYVDHLRSCLASGLEFERGLLHLAVKWNPRDSGDGRIARYTAYPKLSRQQILQRCLSQLQKPGEPADAFASLVAELVAFVTNAVSEKSLIYSEVQVEAKSRSSFDLNVYGADRVVGDIAEFIFCFAELLDVRVSAIDRITKLTASSRLGHLAAGLSEGSPFLTVYYEPQPGGS